MDQRALAMALMGQRAQQDPRNQAPGMGSTQNALPYGNSINDGSDIARLIEALGIMGALGGAGSMMAGNAAGPLITAAGMGTAGAAEQAMKRRQYQSGKGYE